jgi:hypothetical protein
VIELTGKNSIMIENIGYKYPPDHDDLRFPPTTIPSGIDSAYLSFNLAAANTTIGSAALQLLVSTDCGSTYDVLYNKSGAGLATTKPTDNYFIPLSAEWRKDSVDLSPYIGKSNLLICFRSTDSFGNNTFLDDVILRTETLNPLLATEKILITPNPVSGYLTVQFYSQPNDLKNILILNSLGQKLKEIVINGTGNRQYDIDLSDKPKGVYLVMVVFENRKVVKKLIKL